MVVHLALQANPRRLYLGNGRIRGLLDPYVDASLKDDRGVTHENHKGLVDGFRNPKPELYQVKEVYSPVVSDARTVRPEQGNCQVAIQNRYSFTDLSDLTCNWQAMAGEKELASGKSQVACPPGTTVNATFLPATNGMDALVLTFVSSRWPNDLHHSTDGGRHAPSSTAGAGVHSSGWF